MITENVSTLKIHKLTQAQYERELGNGNIDETALYLTPDEEIDMSLYATVEQLNSKFDDYIVLKRGVHYGTESEIPDDLPKGALWFKVVE